MKMLKLIKKNFSLTERRGFYNLERLQKKLKENSVDSLYLGFSDLYGRLNTVKINPERLVNEKVFILLIFKEERNFFD